VAFTDGGGVKLAGDGCVACSASSAAGRGRSVGTFEGGSGSGGTPGAGEGRIGEEG
jgi:hypothetical protein